MNLLSQDLTFHDYSPTADDFESDVLEGLSKVQKELPCKYIYDERGSILFDQICELEEYYPTRTEMKLLETRAGEIAEWVGPKALVIEYGSGNSAKVPFLLNALDQPAGYVPIEISKDHMENAAARLLTQFNDLKIIAICADYSTQIKLPDEVKQYSNRLLFFPGSTIGNFEPVYARQLLKRMREMVNNKGRLLIGVDLIKDLDVLHAAYNDSEGITAEFNLNLLRRINRELDGNFDLEKFEHQAHFNPEHSRMEMHLASKEDQTASVGGQEFIFNKDETIFTESSYKYSLAMFETLANEAGWDIEHIWTDTNDWFSLQLLRCQ